MKLPENVLLYISYIKFYNVRAKAIIKVLREAPSKSDSLDTITYVCVFYAHEKYTDIDPKDTYTICLTNKEIKKWRKYKPEDAPLVINWKFLSDEFKKIAF